MFRFTIRDIFWLILLVAFFLTWWREGLNLDSEKRTLENEVRLATSAAELAQVKLEKTDSYFISEGWHTYASPSHFEMGIDSDVCHGGQSSAFIKAIDTSTDDLAFLAQSISADQYRGQCLQLSAYVKTENADDTWLCIEAKKGPAARARRFCYRQMPKEVDWNRCLLVLEVPEDSAIITFGVIANGGTTWIDDLQIEIVDSNTPLNSQRYFGPPLVQPSMPINYRSLRDALNLDFEK